MDKSVFYAFCSAASLPIPKLLAVFDRPIGWAADGRPLKSRDEWLEFLQSLPEDFIVKPAMGLQGRGVTAFRRDAHEFVDHDRQRFTDSTLYDFLFQQSSRNLFAAGYSHHSLRLPYASHKTIIQQRLYAHPAILDLTGSAAISTARLFTHTDGSGTVWLLGSAFRVINGDNIVDNLDRGARGNLWCSVETKSGYILDAFVKPADADRLHLVDRHPTTKREIVGFRIPDWERAIELASRLAMLFHPQPSITWDIGITDRGPVVIEGNICGQLLPTPLNVPVRALFDDKPLQLKSAGV
jgi:hypothetical protein